MTHRVLYFPNIEPPDSPWTSRMLLYWDEVAAIVPYEFVERPERLGRRMRALVREGLVTQVIPGMYVSRIDRFVDAFVGHLTSLGPELDARRVRFAKQIEAGGASRVHLEKLHEATRELESMGLAKRKDGAWCLVEPETAFEFMAYLAAVLGKQPKLNLTPTTDHEKHLERFIRASSDTQSAGPRLAALRMEVLEDLLPAPHVTLEAAAIRKFKDRHGDELSRFRRKVEEVLITVADLNNPELRARRLALFREEAADEIAQIESQMKETGFGRIVLSTLSAVVSNASGVPKGVGLAAAVLGALVPSERAKSNSPFLYAAMARQRLGPKGRS